MHNEDPSSPTDSHSRETVAKVLADIGWQARTDEESAGFIVDFDPPYLPIAHAYAAVSDDPELFIFYLNFGVAASPARREQVATFLTLVNSSLAIGNFEMDYDDGLVRFRSSVAFGGSGLTEALVRNCILHAMDAVEKYADALIEVIARGKNPASAFREAEAHQ